MDITIQDIQRGLEVKLEDASRIFNMFQDKKLTPKSILQETAIILQASGVSNIRLKKGTAILQYVEMNYADVKTLTFDCTKKEFLICSVNEWVTNNVDLFTCVNEPATPEGETDEDEDDGEVEDDEPYILFYWDDSSYLAVQASGMKDMIEQKGMPIAHEIKSSCLDLGEGE